VDVVLGLAVALVAMATLAGALLVVSAMWRGLGDQWRRAPDHGRRRGLVGGVLAAAWIVTAAILWITAPWGQRSVVYVIGIGGGALMLLTLGAVAVQAVRDTRRAKRRMPET
jgi:peptidoglycan biosynthesis protein MviN/MurJ (putative lipid II flippase)